jgi:class 3 adenylate cyclase
MGFGIHVGWAIEGSIGSYYKIDAIYLSLHVNIPARLESATRQYGIPLLMSGQLYDLCTKKFK